MLRRIKLWHIYATGMSFSTKPPLYSHSVAMVSKSHTKHNCCTAPVTCLCWTEDNSSHANCGSSSYHNMRVVGDTSNYHFLYASVCNTDPWEISGVKGRVVGSLCSGWPRDALRKLKQTDCRLCMHGISKSWVKKLINMHIHHPVPHPSQGIYHADKQRLWHMHLKCEQTASPAGYKQEHIGESSDSLHAGFLDPHVFFIITLNATVKMLKQNCNHRLEDYEFKFK